MPILALDQGTTSSRAILFTEQGTPLAQHNTAFPQLYPQPGWVEHDPEDIWASQLSSVCEALSMSGIAPKDIGALGLTNQRETTLVWDRKTGKCVYNAIVWQCRRTADECRRLEKQGYAPLIREKTGLALDAYFSATKLAWILDHIPDGYRRAADGDLLFGTVDTFLLWRLTGGRVHATDHTNASRTMLYNLIEHDWDADLLRLFGIPRVMLPEIRHSSDDFGVTNGDLLGAEIPIGGVAGDQQAALFGQCCLRPGEAKNTYGTGCFLLMHTGAVPVFSQHGLVTTMAATTKNEPVAYALEGSVFVAGAAVQWLRDELHLISSAAETEALARSVPDTNGVVLVPAFTGLGAPYWDGYARGALFGLTRGANRAHIARAALCSIALQTQDVLSVMEQELGTPVSTLKVDGGASVNGFLMQYQADISGARVVRPIVTETTALGAAYLAGLSTGLIKNTSELRSNWQEGAVFIPEKDEAWRKNEAALWQRAVSRTRAWEEEA
ncbi:MAG: glycerol kinase GlpK [Clostridia bacterium]|nr:glycerol kinase GlpK [Clostridia bacterium]